MRLFSSLSSSESRASISFLIFSRSWSTFVRLLSFLSTFLDCLVHPHAEMAARDSRATQDRITGLEPGYRDRLRIRPGQPDRFGVLQQNRAAAPFERGLDEQKRTPLDLYPSYGGLLGLAVGPKTSTFSPPRSSLRYLVPPPGVLT